jgi:hypothetical protein
VTRALATARVARMSEPSGNLADQDVPTLIAGLEQLVATAGSSCPGRVAFNRTEITSIVDAISERIDARPLDEVEKVEADATMSRRRAGEIMVAEGIAELRWLVSRGQGGSLYRLVRVNVRRDHVASAIGILKNGLALLAEHPG